MNLKNRLIISLAATTILYAFFYYCLNFDNCIMDRLLALLNSNYGRNSGDVFVAGICAYLFVTGLAFVLFLASLLEAIDMIIFPEY